MNISFKLVSTIYSNRYFNVGILKMNNNYSLNNDLAKCLKKILNEKITSPKIHYPILTLSLVPY